MKNKGWMVFILIVVTAVAVLLLRRGEPEGGKVKVGICLPLSGDAKIYGDEMLRGIRLALKSQPADTEGMHIVTVVEDDAGKSVTSLNAFTKLVDIDGVHVVIGGAMSSTAAPLVPMARERAVALVSPAASAPDLCSPGSYFFRVWPSDVYDATALAGYSLNKLNAQTAAVLYVNNDYGKGASDAFGAEFARLGGKIVLSEGYAQDAVDFRTALTKIASLNPSVLYVPGYYKELASMLRQFAELGLRVQVLGGVGFKEPKILELAGTAAEGVIFTTPYYDANSSDSFTADFARAYETEYGEKPGIFAAHGFDAARVVADAIAKGAKTGSDIRAHLLNLKNFPGAAGALTFTPSGDVVKPVAFHIVRNGQFMQIESR